MKTKKQLEKMTKIELAKLVQQLEREKKEATERHGKERDDHLGDIMNLQARVTTMRHQQLREHHELVACRKLIDGLKAFDVIGHQARMFDIRRVDVMERIAELLRKSPLHPLPLIRVCPMCGEITEAKQGKSGERICEKCRREADWPWVGEIVWRVNEEGNMEGLCRGEYVHPDGGTISIKQQFKAAE